MRIRLLCMFTLMQALMQWGLSPVVGGGVDLNNRTDGLYSPVMLNEDWDVPHGESGVTQGRASIVSGLDAYEGKSLRILYPANEAGPLGDNPPFTGSGAQWFWDLGGSFNEMILEYKVKFAADFDFVLGGKLPGLVGGTANTGGNVPDGMDGWSARMMWENDSDAIHYVYHPDQPGTFGDIMPWNVGGQRKFVPGVWHTIRQRVVMNTPTQNDGTIQGWFDGELAFDRQDIRFRDTDTFAIDTMYFSTFFGGSGATFAPLKDESIFFDDFLFTTNLADFNTDLIVNNSDLAVWENRFGIASGAELNEGDANRDLDVDGSDFLAWQRAFTPASGLPSPLAVPEPSVGILALLSIMFFAMIDFRLRTECIGLRSIRAHQFLTVVVACSLGLNSTQADQIGDSHILTWKDGQTAAATLTIDDNWKQDHDWWTATADTFDIRLTWFVISERVGAGNTSINGSWSDFIDLQAAGHDIQSHTVDHFPNFPSPAPLPLATNYSQAVTDIETNVPGSDVLTLAYPFGLQAPNDKALAGQHYIAARGVTGTLNTLGGVDYLNVNSLTTDFYGVNGGFPLPGNVPNSHFAYIPNLITPGKSHYEGWLSVHSHGVTSGNNDKKDAITELLTYLTATPGEFWVAPFTEVAQYAQERDVAQVSTQVINPKEIQYTLTDTLDDTRFNEPLTVKVRVDNAWSQVVATQDGLPLPVTLIQESGEQFALVNSVPDLGIVSLAVSVPDPHADFDEDEDIDGADFLTWQRGFFAQNGAIHSEGDANFDGVVNDVDLVVWQTQYAGVFGAAATIGVPEPLSANLLLLGLLVYHFYER